MQSHKASGVHKVKRPSLFKKKYFLFCCALPPRGDQANSRQWHRKIVEFPYLEHIFSQLPTIYLSRDIKSVSELYRQSSYVSALIGYEWLSIGATFTYMK
jgi:hypothetical protein